MRTELLKLVVIWAHTYYVYCIDSNFTFRDRLTFFSNLSHFPAGKPLHFCRHMISTGIQNNRHGSSIAVIYILMPRRTKIVRAVGFLAFSASCMGRRLKVATSVVYSQQSAFNPLIRGLCRNWLGRKALSI